MDFRRAEWTVWRIIILHTKRYICGQNVGDDLVLKHRQFNFLCKFCSNLLTKIQGIKCFLKSGTDVSKYGNMAENRS